MSKTDKSTHEHAQTTTKLVSEEKAVNKVEEKEMQFEPLPNPNRSNDKEVSIEAHSFFTIPLETHHETQVSFIQCLEELSFVEIFKGIRTQDHKFRNRVPKRIFRRKLLGYIRWQNIFLEGYLTLKKKGWKGLVGHPYERGRRGILSILFSTLYF